mgnify:FL=1
MVVKAWVKLIETIWLLLRRNDKDNYCIHIKEGAVAQVEVKETWKMKNEKIRVLSKGDVVSQVSVEIQNSFDKGLVVNKLYQ